MKGVNTFEINQETLLEALQEYFDKRLVMKPVITEIYLPNNTGLKMGTGNSIKVTVQENGAFLNGEKT